MEKASQRNGKKNEEKLDIIHQSDVERLRRARKGFILAPSRKSMKWKQMENTFVSCTHAFIAGIGELRNEQPINKLRRSKRQHLESFGKRIFNDVIKL